MEKDTLTKHERQHVIQALILSGMWVTAAKYATKEEFALCVASEDLDIELRHWKDLHAVLLYEGPPKDAHAPKAVPKPETVKDWREETKPLVKAHWTSDKAKVEAAHRKASATRLRNNKKNGKKSEKRA